GGVDGHAGNNARALAGSIAIGNGAGAAGDADGEHAAGARGPDPACLPATQNPRRGPRTQMLLTRSERKLVDPVAGDGVTNVLRTVAAIAGTAQGNLRLHAFAAAEIAVVDGMRPHVLRAPIQTPPDSPVQRDLERLKAALAVLPLLVH